MKERYRNENYIAFTSFVDVHEVLGAGWTVHPDKSIRPGAAFDVVMSSKGEANVRLRYGSRLIYEWQIAVRERNKQGSARAYEYVLREYDHARGIRLDEQVLEEPPKSHLLSHQALEPAEWCATGGYVTTFVGSQGRVANPDCDPAFAEMIDSGTLLEPEEGPGGVLLDVVRYVQQKPAGPRRGPAGQKLDARPAVWWDTFVDRNEALIVRQDGYMGFPDREPVLLRRKRYEDIRFPKHVDPRMFTDVPRRARGYRVWKPGEPYDR